MTEHTRRTPSRCDLIEGDWFSPALRARVNAAVRRYGGREPFDTSVERHQKTHGGAGC